MYNLDRVLAVAAQPRVPYQRGLALLNALHSTLGANQLGEANEVGAKAPVSFLYFDLNIVVCSRIRFTFFASKSCKTHLSATARIVTHVLISNSH